MLPFLSLANWTEALKTPLSQIPSTSQEAPGHEDSALMVQAASAGKEIERGLEESPTSPKRRVQIIFRSVHSFCTCTNSNGNT